MSALVGTRGQRRPEDHECHRRRPAHRPPAVAAFEASLPIVLAAHAAIALRTLARGWRIVRTLGTKITRLQPVGGFAAETAAAATR